MLICCCYLKRVVNSCCSCCPYVCLSVCRSVYVSTVPLTWFCPVFRKQTSLACSLPRGPNTQKCRHIQQPHFSWTVDVENLKKILQKYPSKFSSKRILHVFVSCIWISSCKRSQAMHCNCKTRWMELANSTPQLSAFVSVSISILVPVPVPVQVPV